MPIFQQTPSTTPIIRPVPFNCPYDVRAWQAISKNWVTSNCREHVVAVTLETAWNTPHSTAAGYQQVGHELGRAIESYLRGHR